jgi:UDP-N-acetylglucosamine 2-epimerase (non-hydrolysing)
MQSIVQVVGARPNFVKMAPVIDALAAGPGLRQLVVHTGQHYDERLSAEMLSDLEFPEPDLFLGIGSGTHAEQTGKALIALERVLLEHRPSLVVVGGDVNSTLAAALAASKLGIPVAHVEAGLRSRDWTMPEEINRVITDRLSAYLFTHSPEAEQYLMDEGIDPERVHYVGNTMIDSLRRFEPKARARAAWSGFGAGEGEYVLVTLHRPSNVDRPDQLEAIARALIELRARTRVLFPVHPRTRARLELSGMLTTLEDADVQCLPPVGYLDFLSLELGAGAIITDSGGVQEEASALGVPCYTVRPNTERPVTIELGTNVLLGEDAAQIASIEVFGARGAPADIPLWDGRAGIRIAEIITRELLGSAEGVQAVREEPASS